jgi:hypothetical protein
VAYGLSRLWKYESRPGTAAAAPVRRPVELDPVLSSGRPSLLVFLHPHCPCSRATVAELDKIMADCDGRLSATVFVLRPASMSSGWEKTDLWTDAAAIPGVRVVCDEASVVARRFGAATSGQALLYAADGRLLFSGGITESRGHVGDNAGADAVRKLTLNPNSPPEGVLYTDVFGCSLHTREGVE